MIHQHNHQTGEINSGRLLIAVLLNVFISLVELVGGWMANSYALLSDAIHNLSDTFTILASYFAIKIGKKKTTLTRTFGYKRVEILTAFINSTLLLIVCLYLIYQGIERFVHPEMIKEKYLFIVASFAVLANLSAVLLLRKDSAKNINVKTSYLHLLSDVLSSIALIIGSLLVYFFHIQWIDPLLTILISLFIFKELLPVMIKSIKILLQISPVGIDIKKIQEELQKLTGVKDLHHIHIWSLSEKDIYFEGHILFEQDFQLSQTDQIRKEFEKILTEKYGIAHVTLQAEYDFCENNQC